jgi:endonuclease/exonuclease/phosphatase (EEP) superfamily protein YafD
MSPHYRCRNACYGYSPGISTNESQDEKPSSRPVRLRRTLTVAGSIALAVAAIGGIARYLPIWNHVLLFTAVFSPYLMLGAFAAIPLFLLARRKIMAAVAVIAAILAVAVQVPMYMGEQYEPRSVRIRVMTVNLFEGQADSQAVVDRAKVSADVVAVQELTRRSVKELSAAGLGEEFPYQALDARAGASGTGLWSRFPIREWYSYKQYTHAMVRARIHVDGVVVDPTVFVVHLPGPWPEAVDTWSREIDSLNTTMENLTNKADSGCVIAAGDFNDTVDTKNFRRLLGTGYRDAAEQTGSGITATYPANIWLPPLIAIDHVLTHQCSATVAKTVKLPGSDHRGLLVGVAIPSS